MHHIESTSTLVVCCYFTVGLLLRYNCESLALQLHRCLCMSDRPILKLQVFASYTSHPLILRSLPGSLSEGSTSQSGHRLEGLRVKASALSMATPHLSFTHDSDECVSVKCGSVLGVLYLNVSSGKVVQKCILSDSMWCTSSEFEGLGGKGCCF